MSLSSFFRKSAPPSNNAAIIELVYAGNDMAAHLVMRDGRDYSCVCGMIVGPVENPSHHHNFCPVARFYAAIESMRLPMQDQNQAEADRELAQQCAENERMHRAGMGPDGIWHKPDEDESTRTGRYSTPREDAAVFAVLGTITAALIWAVAHFARKAGLPW